MDTKFAFKEIRAFALAASLVSIAVTGKAQTYTATDLGGISSTSTKSVALGLNNHGDVVGYFYATSGKAHAFLYTGGKILDLDTAPGSIGSAATGINNSGQLIGTFSSFTSVQAHAVRYTAGIMTNLGTLPGGALSRAAGINDLGQVVGHATAAGGKLHAFLHSEGSMIDLGALPGADYSSASGINNNGQVVGYSYTESSTSADQHAFLYTNGGMLDLGMFTGDTSSSASAINNGGQVVGDSSKESRGPLAFLYSAGNMVNLGTLPGDTGSIAYGINNSGQIVGVSEIRSADQTEPRTRAFLFSDGKMKDLTSLVSLPPGVHLASAVAINDHGQIAANGSDGHAYLLSLTTCSYVVSPMQINAPAAGASGAFSVSTQPGCSVFLSSNQPWVKVSSLFGYLYSVDPNTGPSRGATLLVGSVIVSVNQAGGTFAPSTPVLDTPQNQATSVSLNPTLGWEPSNNALSFDLYFGTSNPPPIVSTNITSITSYRPGPLTPITTYYWYVVAKNTGGSTSSSVFSFTTAPITTNGFRFVPVAPCRVVDTRDFNSPTGGPYIAGGGPRDFTMTQSLCGIPPNAIAFSLNVTVVPLGPLGFLSIWPAGQPQPGASTLNSSDGRVKANAAIVPAGTAGRVTVFASDPTHVIIDINGYFIADPGGQALAFYPVTPCRIADTRTSIGFFAGPSLAPNVTRPFPIQISACNVPGSAKAYALNITAIPLGPLGFISAWPSGNPQPGASTLNAPTGTIVANAAIIPAGGPETNGGVQVIATNATDLIIDINGYFAAPGAPGALSFYPVTPCRIMDTRDPVGTFGGPIIAGNTSRDIPVMSSACGIPSTAKAYSLNATVVPPAPLGFLSLWNTGGFQPGVSTLNASDGSVMANAAIVPAGTSGSVTAYMSNASHLILDINGYFAP